MDVIANPGEIGGVVAVGSGIFENITYTGRVTIKNVAPEAPIAKYGTVIGSWAPIYRKNLIVESTLSSANAVAVEYTDNTSATITQKVGARAY